MKELKRLLKDFKVKYNTTTSNDGVENISFYIDDTSYTAFPCAEGITLRSFNSLCLGDERIVSKETLLYDLTGELLESEGYKNLKDKENKIYKISLYSCLAVAAAAAIAIFIGLLL